ncbi:MAG: hybrid sensor histidine kinase/response regulator [Roseovarius sp.]|nr:hybrid sensor histidine kinase/response regulator [Roseovarius sp.]
MAFPGISAGQGRQPAAQAGARARLLLVTALAVFAASLAVTGGRLGVGSLLPGLVILFGALWPGIRAARARGRAGRARAGLAALIEEDPVPVVLAGRDGDILHANAAARRVFPAAGGATLATLLRDRLANPGPLLFRIESRAAATGAAAEEIVTREGHIRMAAHRAGEDRFLWRLEPSFHPPSPGAEHQPLPMLTVGRNNTVLSMNPAARALIGERIASLDEICRTPPPSGGSCEIPTAEGGSERCVYVELPGQGGRREVLLLPGARNPVAASDDWAMLDSLPVPLLVLDAEGRILRVTPPALSLLGCEKAEGLRLAEMLEGLGRPVVDWIADAAAGRGGVKPEFLRVRRADRESFVKVGLERARLGEGEVLIAVLTDATELKSLQAQFVQSQKMQAIGQLAGGIAHDFNNLLTAISGHCDLLLLHRDPGDPEYSDLMQITQNVNRAAALVAQLLAFSRKQTLRPRILDLRDTLADLTHLLNRLVGEQVSLTLEHEAGLGAVRADKRQIEQVILNLVVNARDAMPGGGEIRIVTRNLTLEAPLRRDRAVVAPGRYVSVEVIDTGHGIAADKIDHVFEPFFTTKKVGEGTGLGLSTAYGIVKQTGGFIFADSVEGEGTTFQLLFPAHERPETPETPEEARPAARSADSAPGQGVVLLVEDEAPVRAFASRALRLRGFSVLEAASAEEALELLGNPACHVDVFVTDVVMPGMDGPGWVQQALVHRPEVRVVFMSGYAEETFGDIQARIANSVFLPKPFSLGELAETVQRMAAKGGADPPPERMRPAAQPDPGMR